MRDCLPQAVIFLFCHRLLPLCGAEMHFGIDGDMTEFAVGHGAVPVDYICRNSNDIAGIEYLHRFTFFLVASTACCGDKDLAAGM